MPVEIIYDGIRPVDHRQPAEQAVIDAVGNRPGRWKAWLTQGDGDPGFAIRVDGLDSAEFSYRFFEAHERAPDFVRARIQQGLRQLNGLSHS